MERVTKSAEACLTALNIMTSLHMPKAVYIEDVIERILQYTKFHLQNTLYPQYDPVYRVNPKGGETLTSPNITHSPVIQHCSHLNACVFTRLEQVASINRPVAIVNLSTYRTIYKHIYIYISALSLHMLGFPRVMEFLDF